jgi:hypothetical protein
MLNKCGKRRIATGRVDILSSLRLAPLVNEVEKAIRTPRRM